MKRLGRTPTDTRNAEEAHERCHGNGARRVSRAGTPRRPGPSGALTILVLALSLWTRPAVAHGPEMMLGSTVDQGGALALSYDFTDIVAVSPDVTLGGTTLYDTLFPGIEWLQTAAPPLYVLQVGTPFSLQIVSIDAGAAVMVGDKTLNAAGQSAFVANTTNIPGDHFHPQWELLLPAGMMGEYSVSFKLTTTSPLYASSDTYTLLVTNLPQPTNSPTPSPSPSPDPRPSPATSTPVAGTPSPEAIATNTSAPTGTETAIATMPLSTATVPVPTATTGVASPTSSAPSTATPTAIVSPVCPGDCNGDGIVSISELVTAVAISLGDSPVALCPAADGDRSGTVLINELILAVNSALDGCPSAVDR